MNTKKITCTLALIVSFSALADRTATEGWVAKSITNAMDEVNAHTDAQGVLLQAGINTESANRVAADTIMSNQISNQTANIATQVALLNGAINNEADARKNADATITNTVKSLQQNVASLTVTVNNKADAPTDGSVIASQTWVENKHYATATQLSGKQDTLVSGTNIKTINGASILGSGNITIEGGGATGDYLPLAGGSVYGPIAVTNATLTTKKTNMTDSNFELYSGLLFVKYGLSIIYNNGASTYTYSYPNKTGTFALVDDVTAEHTAMTNAVETEVTNRGTAITSAISTEVSNRNTAISTAISTEVSNRNTAISTAVATETSNRTTAIAAEHTAMTNTVVAATNAEATVRAAADTALGSRIDTFERKLIDEVDLQVVSNKYRTASWELATNSLAYTDHPVKLTVQDSKTLEMSGEWPNAKPVYIYVEVEGDYTPKADIQLIGYGTWPTTSFQCAVWYVDVIGKYYMNIIMVNN